MGLDITAYKKIKPLDCVFNKNGEPINPKTKEAIENYWNPTNNNYFPERATDINFETVYSFESFLHIHAGSYGGYNNWREQLAEMAGWPAVEIERYGAKVKSFQAATHEAKDGDFFELIMFSDCEGTLGTKTCQKLLKDFEKFQEKANQIGGYFLEKYNQWRKAFEHASENGAISFH